MSNDSDFMRDFQRCVDDIAQMQATAYTAMELHLGSEATARLAPHLLQGMIESGERYALEMAQRRQQERNEALRMEFERGLTVPPASQGRHKQITIDEALQKGEGDRPW